MSFLDRLKAIGDAAKGVVLWILAPLTAIVLGVLYFFTKEQDLKNQVADLQAEKEVTKDETIDDETTKNADAAVSDYYKLKQQYTVIKGGSDDPGKAS